MKPKVPKVVEPKRPIEADFARDEGKLFGRAIRPQGLTAFVRAGQLTTKATTRKASLLG